MHEGEYAYQKNVKYIYMTDIDYITRKHIDIFSSIKDILSNLSLTKIPEAIYKLEMRNFEFI